MIQGKALLSLLLVSLALTSISCSDKCENPKPESNDQMWQIRRVGDYDYVDRTYFDLTRRDSLLSDADLMPGDTITYLELYCGVSAGDPYYTSPRSCSLFVDPFNKSKYPDETTSGTYLCIPNDPFATHYFFHPTAHYIVMETPMGGSMGAYIKYRRLQAPGHSWGSEREIGRRSPEGIVILKLIASGNPQPSDITWNYVWRNVYGLGVAIDDVDNLHIEIRKGRRSLDGADSLLPDNQAGRTFIYLLGLDKNNDGQVDTRDPQILDPVRGHLRFPRSRTPFADSVLDVRSDSIYITGDFPKQYFSKYFLVVRQRID